MYLPVTCQLPALQVTSASGPLPLHYSIFSSNISFVTAVPCCRERGLLAEGAKFLVSSLEVDLALLEAADTGRDLRSFYFFPLLRPGNPDTAQLATRRGCGDQCRCRLRDPRL